MDFFSFFKVLLPAFVIVSLAGAVQAEPLWMRAQNGAIVFNPNPQTNETVVWSGDIDEQGYATGEGILVWCVDGEPIQALIGRLSYGRSDGLAMIVEPGNQVALVNYRAGQMIGEPILLQPDPTPAVQPATPAPQRPQHVDMPAAPRVVIPQPQPVYTPPVYTPPAPVAPAPQTPSFGSPYVPNFGGLTPAEKAAIQRRFGGLSQEEKDRISLTFGGLGR